MPKVLLTGGGTAGHVTPNIALFPYLKERGFDIEYIGSYNGIEKELITPLGVPYTGIATGKMRRYLSAKNVSDVFRIIKGTGEAKKHMQARRPDVVFSKGGFVAVPVVWAAASCGIPVVIHESDLSPGLANKLCYSKANVICYNFPETEKYLKDSGCEEKMIRTGLPIRDSLRHGSAEKGRALCGFTDEKPVLVVIGGSLGALHVNNAVKATLPQLLEKFQVAHICGEGKTDETLDGTPGYKQFTYLNKELADVLAAADVLISRAGANAIWELAALHKPAVLIPLGTGASRGDQILNAQSFKEQGFAEVLLEENLSTGSLFSMVCKVYDNREKYIDAMRDAGTHNAAEQVADIIAGQIKAE